MSDHEQQNITNNNQDTRESATPAIVSPPTENNGAGAGGEGNSDLPKEEKFEDSKNRINLKVVDGNGGEIWFKVKRATPMKKIMHAYCEKQSKSEDSIRFFFDGNRVNATQTPEELDMEDNDVIEAHHAQLGGCSF
ncbi:SMT3 [Candida metapsilosis]|uniref:SMT3 n=1 Tax=Candida metapsilosis TaxID=273372 RepID=A0A8H7ZBM0_9ASCO|nr:SMT3 [Candida metapsilosis]